YFFAMLFLSSFPTRRSSDLSGAIDPVIESHDPLGVVVTGFVGVIDDQRGVEPAVELQTDMGVEEVGAGIGGDELVGERGVRCGRDRKSTRLNSSSVSKSYAV